MFFSHEPVTDSMLVRDSLPVCLVGSREFYSFSPFNLLSFNFECVSVDTIDLNRSSLELLIFTSVKRS